MDREPISDRLRYAIFKRDGFRCQICSIGREDKAILEIDHKISICDGGTNDPTNLQTACRSCNRGKRGDSDYSPSEPLDDAPTPRKRHDPDQPKT